MVNVGKSHTWHYGLVAMKALRHNYDKLQLPTSLMHLSLASQPDHAAGRPPLWTASLISSVFLTRREKAR